MSQDVDHRVREATQQAMEQLVLRVGRNLAPHLRYVIGPWLCSQFDTYAVVASSGRKSFQAAFSDEKQAEVIMFCRKELFEVCYQSESVVNTRQLKIWGCCVLNTNKRKYIISLYHIHISFLWCTHFLLAKFKVCAISYELRFFPFTSL